MARLLIYDAYENKVYTYANLNENDPMPYSTGTTLRVREFRGKSASPTLWTTIAAMEAWNLTRRKYGKGIPVGYAFRRIWEGGHGTRSQHYAGVSFDVGQSLTQTARTAIYNAARGTGAWGYVEPLSQTPTWVHMDRRYGTPACSGTTARLPHPEAGKPRLLCDDSAGRAFHAGLPDREPHRRHLWCPDGGSAERLPAAHEPACGRCVRLQQLEKDQHRRHRRGTDKNDDRLAETPPVTFGASPLGDGAFGKTASFSSSPEAPSLRELANPKGLTEGVPP